MSHTRFTGGYDFDPIRAWVARNGVTNEIGRTFVTTTNDIEHVWQFRVETAGTYTVGIQGTDYWTSESGAAGKHHDSVIDGLSLVRVREPAADVPSVPQKMKLSLAEDSRLRLDFDGEITIGTVTLKGMALATIVAILLSITCRIIARLRGEPFTPSGETAEKATGDLSK